MPGASETPAGPDPASAVPASAVPASTIPASAVPASTIPASTIPASTARTGIEVADLIRARIRDVPDYPQPGVVFKDITPLLADGAAFAAVVSALAAGHGRIDKVAGIEARGFILAAPVAYALGAGFVPVRKEGKLPGPTYAQSYQLEYGMATVEVHSDAFTPGERVLIIDDVLATGGTAAATAQLVQRGGAQVVAISVLLELGFLDGRAKLPDLEVRSLLGT